MNDYNLWDEASRDVESENHLRTMAVAKAASAGIWKFLALASSQEEYENRKALSIESLVRVANKSGLVAQDLLDSYDKQFRLLREAKDFTVEIKDDDPDDKSKFDDKSDDKDDKGNDDDAPSSDDDDSDDDEDEDGDNDDKGGKGKVPQTTKPHQKPSSGGGEGDSKSGGMPWADDDSDDSSDSDDDGGDSGSDDDNSDKDSDDSDGKSDDGKPAFLKGSSLDPVLARIEAGEDPLNWHGGSFLKVADDDPGMQDESGSDQMSNMPEDDSIQTTEAPLTSSPSSAGAPTTAPSGTNTNMGSTGSLHALAAEVGESNPQLPYGECMRLAKLTYESYLKKFADNPLMYGDKASEPDGPITRSLKHYSPPNLTGGNEGGDPDSQPNDPTSTPATPPAPKKSPAANMAEDAAGVAVKALPDLLARRTQGAGSNWGSGGSDPLGFGEDDGQQQQQQPSSSGGKSKGGGGLLGEIGNTIKSIIPGQGGPAGAAGDAGEAGGAAADLGEVADLAALAKRR